MEPRYDIGVVYPAYGVFQCVPCSETWISLRAWRDFGQRCDKCGEYRKALFLDKLYYWVCTQCGSQWVDRKVDQPFCGKCHKSNPKPFSTARERQRYMKAHFLRTREPVKDQSDQVLFLSHLGPCLTLSLPGIPGQSCGQGCEQNWSHGNNTDTDFTVEEPSIKNEKTPDEERNSGQKEENSSKSWNFFKGAKKEGRASIVRLKQNPEGNYMNSNDHSSTKSTVTQLLLAGPISTDSDHGDRDLDFETGNPNSTSKSKLKDSCCFI